MRRYSSLRKIADFIEAQFLPHQVKRFNLNKSVVLYVPYLPGIVCTMVSSNVRVAVYPLIDKVLIRLYKYE